VAVAGALPQPLLERVSGEVGGERGGAAPADDASGVDVHDERDVDPARPGRDVGQVGDPQSIRRRCPELPLHEILRAGVEGLGGDGGALDLAADRAEQAELAHQPFDLATRHQVSLTAQLLVDLAHAVDPEVVVEDLLHERLELLVPDRPR
jgi:hypothetical protein